MTQGFTNNNDPMFPSTVVGTSITNPFPYAIITTNTAVGPNQMTVECNAAAGGFTVTLPASPNLGEKHAFPRTDSVTTNDVVINGNGKLIMGSATVVLGITPACIEVQYNGTQWVYI